jgi:hypothetical protein
MRRLFVCGCSLLVLTGVSLAAPAPAPKSAREALQAFNDLIGSWRGTGEPAGSLEERQRNFWQEKIAWQWQFKKDDVFLVADISQGKYFTAAELRYLPEGRRYQLKARTPARQTLVFEGKLDQKRLTLERKDDRTREVQRLIVSLLHSNRYVVSYEVKPADRTRFGLVYRLGATKEGVPFASEDDGPECVVSGGLGTIRVSYKGKTYYVCCSGCRTAFNDNPEKYIREYEERQKAKKSE